MAAALPTLEPETALAREVAGPVAGVDEAGRGPWAGPVVAAAVILDSARLPAGITDSKQLSKARRESLYPAILAAAEVGIGWASAAEIDALNILQATYLAMQRAIAALPRAPGAALVDGNRAPPLPCPCRTLIKGDALSLSIAAASIVAKVSRDREMTRLAAEHPAYGWERNAGYGTAEHQAALARFGPTAHHRRSFAPIRALLAQEAAD